MKLWTPLLVYFLLGTVSVFSVQAAGDDADDIQIVIDGQLKAFAENDAQKAYSFAAPEIRETFATPEGFMDMVQLGYPIVYHHTAVHFLKPKIGELVSFQLVEMTDEDGIDWLVLYQLHKQDDGGWLISGVVVLPGNTPTQDDEAPSTSA